MAWGDLVQSQHSTDASKAATKTATYDSTPTSGNLLVCCSMTRANTISMDSSGWSLGVRNTNTGQGDDSAIWYKIAGASESTTVTVSDGDSNQKLAVSIFEYEGAWESSPLDKTATSSPNSSVTSEETGSTGTLSQADELAMAMCAIRGGASEDPESASIDSSFTYQLTSPGAPISGTFNAYVLSASRVVSATTALNPSFSWTNSLEAWGCIATFKKEGAAGGLSIPVAMHHRVQQGMS